MTPRPCTWPDGELAAINYGSLVGVVTEDEWRARAGMLMQLKYRIERERAAGQATKAGPGR